MATFQLGSSVILLFPRHSDILDQIDVKIPINQLSHTVGSLNSAGPRKQYQGTTDVDSTETHPEGELDIVVMVSEH